MAPLDIDTALEWRGRTVVDRDGEKIGTFDELYLDADDRPAWAAVKTGLFGRRQSFVPLAQAQQDEDRLRVPFAKDLVEASPNVDPDEQLSDDEEDRLFGHYGLTPPGPAGGDDEPVAREDEDEGEHDDAERADGGDAAAEVVRSEEELVVGTRRRPTHRVRLKKYVVTDHVKRTVPVQREEVRVEYEPSEGEQRPARDEDVPRGADPA